MFCSCLDLEAGEWGRSAGVVVVCFPANARASSGTYFMMAAGVAEGCLRVFDGDGLFLLPRGCRSGAASGAGKRESLH